MSERTDSPPPDAVAVAAPPRPWHRWHVSSILLALLCLAVLAVANVSGYVCWEWERQETGKPYAWHHGWPWTFLERDGVPDPVFGLPTFDRDLWALNRRVIEVDGLALAGNVLAGFGLTLLVAGAFDWRRRRRRRLLQLTISDLAGLTFLVAAVLGYGTWRYRTWERENEALAELERATVSFSEYLVLEVDAGTPHWLRRLLPGNRFRPLDRVAQLQVDKHDVDLAAVAAFRHLPSLVLYVRPRDVTPLSALRALRHLELGEGAASDETLRQFAACRELRTLAVYQSTQITPVGLQHLQDLTALESLELDVSRTSTANDGEDFQWLERMTRLKALAMPAWHFPDQALERVGSLRTLVALDLHAALLQDSGVAHLRTLDSLESLDLSGTEVSDAGMAAIAQLENLTHLRLDRTLVGDEGVAHLAGLTKLVELSLYGTRVTDAGLRHLERLSALETVDVRETEVTEEGVARLRANLPRAVVVYTPPPTPK